jgi:hypothetical protein
MPRRSFRPGAFLSVAGVLALAATSLAAAERRSTSAPSYDLTITQLSWNPATPTAGQPVVFSAIVKNSGTVSTPARTSWRLSFAVDNVVTSWATTSASLAPGTSVTLMATDGPTGVATWIATGGVHAVRARADDQNRLRKELNESNNDFSASLTVASPPPPPIDCSATATTRIGTTRGGSLGFANGYRYAQLTATERDRYMDAFAATGAKWYRMNLEAWSLSEAQDVVARARARGVCVIGNLNANPSGTHWADPPDHQAWATNAASSLVTPLKSDVNVWEIWNEPNLTSFWPSTSESYADLLHRTYLAIKGADPDAVVLGAGLSPAGDSTNPANAVNYWKRVYDWNKAQGRAGSAQLFDGLAHHPYLFPEDPLAPEYATADWNAFYQTSLIHQLMTDPNYGGPTNDGAKQIWATEAGFPTGCSLSECVSLNDAASRIPAMLDKWMNEWGAFTGPFLFHELQEQPGTTGAEHYFGFIRGDWSVKEPMYSAFTTYAARPQ